MTEEVTEMKLKVDLQCPCCCKKVKKILCKFPQIRDQVYDDENNIVKIIVVSSDPEKIRDKLCCKGRKVIKSIEIVEPEKEEPTPPKPVADAEGMPQKGESETPKSPDLVPVSVSVFPIRVCFSQCYEGHPGGPCYEAYGSPVPPPPCTDPYGYPYRYGYRRCYVSCCDEYYFSDESPSACSIM